MDYLPLFLNVQRRPCLVVGGGNVAVRKVETLLRSQASVIVAAPKLCDDLERLHEQGKIVHVPGPFIPDTRQRFDIMIAATEDANVNQQVAAYAKAQGVPVNVVDCPDLCTFIMPAIIDRDPLIVAVSSAGASPVLARRLRTMIESSLPAATGRFATMLRELRVAVKKQFSTLDERRRIWEIIIDGPVAERFYAGDEAGARSLVKTLLEDKAGGDTKQGEVYLVGGGPGDPDLLTLKALRLMQKAEVVLYDRLVPQPILDQVRKDAERVFVGKCGAASKDAQGDINTLLMKHASAGKRVLRLKGGDPFIFGRGFQEIEALIEAGIPFQVVPGITAANGCAACAGIPLTHREVAPTVVLLTAHRLDGEFLIDPVVVTRPKQTVVFYMAGGDLAPLCEWLSEQGLAKRTPAAVVENGTRPNQRVVRSTIGAMAAGDTDPTDSPSLLIVGDVVALAHRPS